MIPSTLRRGAIAVALALGLAASAPAQPSPGAQPPPAGQPAAAGDPRTLSPRPSPHPRDERPLIRQPDDRPRTTARQRAAPPPGAATDRVVERPDHSDAGADAGADGGADGGADAGVRR